VTCGAAADCGGRDEANAMVSNKRGKGTTKEIYLIKRDLQKRNRTETYKSDRPVTCGAAAERSGRGEASAIVSRKTWKENYERDLRYKQKSTKEKHNRDLRKRHTCGLNGGSGARRPQRGKYNGLLENMERDTQKKPTKGTYL